MLDRSLAPDFSKAFSFELPLPETLRLNSGVDLFYLPGIQQEIVKIELIYKAGRWYEPSAGVSNFTANMINKGTDSLSSQKIAEWFDYYGAQLDISAGYDFTSVSLYALEEHLHELFPIFWNVIVNPSFPEDELSLQKEIFIQNLKVNNQKNSFVASKILRKNIFGATHPYGRSIEEDDANRLTREELQSFFKTNFHPFQIYLAGKVSEKERVWLAEKFSELASQTRDEKNYFASPELLGQSLLEEGKVQSSIRLGKEIIDPFHPDYFSLLLVNHILGGYFGSRLMKSVREEKGLTYGIYSSISPFKSSCMISIGADVNTDKKEIAVEEIKKELNILREVLISEEELALAKNHFVGSLQLELANPFSVLDKLKNIRLNGLDINYYHNLIAGIGLSTPESLRATAQKYLNPHSFFEVSVG